MNKKPIIVIALLCAFVMVFATACNSGTPTPSVTVESIQIKSEPTKTVYATDDTALDLTGGKITVHYSDGTEDEKNMTDSEVSVAGFSTTQTGSVTITVTHKTKNATFEITVNAASVTPTAVDVHTDILDTDSKFMLLSNSDEVNAGEAVTFTLAANIGHSVDDAVVKYNGASLTKVDNSIVAYSSVRNAAKLMSIVTLNETEEVDYVKPDEVKYVTYKLDNVPEGFDPSFLTVEETTVTYRLILEYEQGFEYADMNGVLLRDGIYSYSDTGNHTYYVEVPLGKAYQFKLVAPNGYGLQGEGTGIYNTAHVVLGEEKTQEIFGTDFDGAFPGPVGTTVNTLYKSCVITLGVRDVRDDFKVEARYAYPLPDSPVLEGIEVALGNGSVSAYFQNRQRATQTSEFSYEVTVPQNGNLYLYAFAVGKNNVTVEFKISDSNYQSAVDAVGICYSAYNGSIDFDGHDIEVTIRTSITPKGGDPVVLTYTLLITSSEPVQKTVTNLIDIQAGDAKYSISYDDFTKAAKVTSEADASGVSINGFTVTYGTSAALGTDHVILTANTACGITLADSKAVINIFIQQSGFYVQDFLYASEADFDNKEARIDVSEKVELTPDDGKISIFYYAFGITLEIIIEI